MSREAGDYVGQRPLKIVTRRESGLPIVSISGSCTMEQSMRIGETLVPLATDPAVTALILDLRDLDFIESSGLGDVIDAYQKCRKRGAELRLVGPTPSIMRVLEITRLDQLFRICDTVESALFAQPAARTD